MKASPKHIASMVLLVAVAALFSTGCSLNDLGLGNIKLDDLYTLIKIIMMFV